MRTAPAQTLPGALTSFVAAVYLLSVCYLALAPRSGVSGALTPNFVPLASIVDLVFDSAATPAQLAKNVLGNVVLLAPLGVVLYASLQWTWRRALVGVAVVSLCLETVQGLGLTDGRQANVDDLLLNVFGAAAALAVVAGVTKIGRTPSRRATSLAGSATGTRPR